MRQIDQGQLDNAMRAGLGTVFPAAGLVVALGGEVIFQGAYGWLDPDSRRRPATIEACYDLASLTKLFTFTAFMRLVDEGRVRLDDPVISVIPEFAGVRPVGPAEEPLSKTVLPAPAEYEGLRVDAGTITFRHLLAHTSGLAAWRSVYLKAGQGTAGERWARALGAICGWDFFYPPNARIVYSDLGFMLLAEGLCRLTGWPLEACIQRIVLAPLGLRRTGFRPVAGVPFDPGRGLEGMLGDDGRAQAPEAAHSGRAEGLEPATQQAADLPLSQRPSRPVPTPFAPAEICSIRGYRLVGEVDDENCAGLGGIAGHAGLFATAPDVARLCQIYCPGGSSFLKPETVAEMARPQAADGDQRRGLGWSLAGPGAACGPDFGPRSYGHTGFTGTSVWIDPDRGLAVILLTNRVYYGRGAMQIAEFRPLLHSAVVRALEGSA